MQKSQSKIFCIGLSKTGTSSLAVALDILGYRTRDNIGVDRYVTGDLDSSMDLSIIDANDAFTDTPIPSFYRELDVRYPNSRFILTVREKSGWLKSCGKQFNSKAAEKRSEAGNRLFQDLYGTAVFEEEKFSRGYQHFVEGVFQYFRDRPDDLLVMDITAGEGWEKLCPFLGRKMRDNPFPKSNVSRIQWINIENLKKIALDAGLELASFQKKITASDSESAPNLGGVIRKFIYRDSKNFTVKAAKRSHKAIVRELQKLTPDVPVISGLGHDAAYSERKTWNHAWLVDPLNGMDEYCHGGDSYCLGFSLIQDGVPIMGVLYYPAKGAVYYARRGKGSFVKAGESAPLRLGEFVQSGDRPIGIICSQQQDTEQAANLLQKAFPEVRLGSRANPTRKARAYEMIITGEADILFIAEPTREWETAATHVILKEQGKNLLDRETGDENRYNKSGLTNNPVIAR